MFGFSPAKDPDTIPRMLSLSWVPLWLGAAGLPAMSRGVPGRTDADADADADADGLPLSFCRARDSAAMRRSARWLDIFAYRDERVEHGQQQGYKTCPLAHGDDERRRRALLTLVMRHS